jgi:protein-disulfide isomerase
MSKRQEIRERRRREQIRNRILVIMLVVAGALLITFALILPSLNNARTAASVTQTAANAPPAPINTVTPKVFTVPVDMTTVGNPNAPVKVDVWEDFQCPRCAEYSQQTETLVFQNYVETGKVLYTFHFFYVADLNAEGESHHAANAAMCAAEQGRFWDYHDTLFANWNGENQGAFLDPRLVAFAETIGLDMNSFNQCFSEKRYKNFIDQDNQKGLDMGVHGTPSAFVNGTIVNPGYVPSYEQLVQAIESALAGE